MIKRTLVLTSIVVCTLFSACQKNDPPLPPGQIFSVHFREVDSLKTDVLIKNDSVLISLPGNAVLTSLTPVIRYEGVSISPEIQKPADFSNVVKFTVTAKNGATKDFYVRVTRRDALFIGGQTDFISLDTRDGSLLWKESLNVDFTYSNPLLIGDILYAGGIDGNMYAFNARSGRVLWTQYLSSTGIESPATVNGTTLYVGTNDDSFYALDAASGQTKWSYLTHANISTKPAIYNNTVIFGSSDGNVYALDTAAGNKVWSTFVGGIVASSPVLHNGVVFIGSGNYDISALDAATGIRKWSYYTGISMEQSIIGISNGTVYAAGWYAFGNPTLRGSLYAMDEQTGSLKWQGLDSLGFTGPLTIDNGVIYLPADDGNFYAVNASNGDKIWSNQIFPNGAGGLIKDGVVYVGGGGTWGIYALNAGDGTVKWKYNITDLSTSDPAIGRQSKKRSIAIAL